MSLAIPLLLRVVLLQVKDYNKKDKADFLHENQLIDHLADYIKALFKCKF
jgi:hypothetical protein